MSFTSRGKINYLIFKNFTQKTTKQWKKKLKSTYAIKKTLMTILINHIEQTLNWVFDEQRELGEFIFCSFKWRVTESVEWKIRINWELYRVHMLTHTQTHTLEA